MGCSQRHNSNSSDGELLITPVTSRSGETSGSQYRRRQIIIEPLVLFYAMATLPLDMVRTQFLYQKVQDFLNVSLNNATAQSGCDINKSDMGYILREKVQWEASQWTMYITLVQLVPSFFITLLFGIYSDHLGRRAGLILPPLGCMLSILADMAVITFDLPIYFLFLENVEYLFGGGSIDIQIYMNWIMRSLYCSL